MATALDSILDLVKRKVIERAGGQRAGQRGTGFGGGGILGQITDMISQRSRSKNAASRDVRPASEDPYGDPADSPGAKNVRPASEDPYGDPADQKR
jgi:hypothetical protein